jgi:hypothetical protein
MESASVTTNEELALMSIIALQPKILRQAAETLELSMQS